MRELAEAAAGKLSARAGLKPPVDVWSLAEQRGARVVERAMPIDGRLICHDARYEIHISSLTGPARRRFTIAHELGHLWVEEIGLGVSVSREQEEHFCDAFAAALLIPTDWLRSYAAEGRHSLGELRRLARLTQTSLSAMLTRLHDELDWASVLFNYKLQGSRWRLASAVGSDSMFDQEPPASMIMPLFEAAQRSGAPVNAVLPLEVGEAMAPFSVEASVSRSSGLLLMHPRSRAGNSKPAGRWYLHGRWPVYYGPAGGDGCLRDSLWQQRHPAETLPGQWMPDALRWQVDQMPERHS